MLRRAFSCLRGDSKGFLPCKIRLVVWQRTTDFRSGLYAACAASIFGSAGWVAIDCEPGKSETSGTFTANPVSVEARAASVLNVRPSFPNARISSQHFFYIRETITRPQSPGEGLRVLLLRQEQRRNVHDFPGPHAGSCASVSTFQLDARTQWVTWREHREDEDLDALRLGISEKSNFFKLFDTDGDGLISFPEYVFFITLLSIPESKVKAIFQQFDIDRSGQLSRGEFMEMMKAMRKSTGRGNASGIRTGLKATSGYSSVGLVQYLFEDKGKERLLSFEEFISFLHELRGEIDLLEFAHYDVMNIGSIGVEDFGYSVVAGANVQRMQYFIDRISKLASSDIGAAGQRVSKQEFMSFCRLLKHGDTKFQEKIRKHAGDGGRIDMAHFLKLALDCGVILSDIQVRIIFFIFDVGGTESYLQLNFSMSSAVGLSAKEAKKHVQCDKR